MHGCAAGYNVDTLRFGECFIRQTGDVQLNFSVADARRNAAANRIRFLVNLFEHEVRVAAFFGGAGIPVCGQHFFVNRLAVQPEHFYAVLGNHRNFTGLRQQVLLSVLQQNGHVRGNEVFTFAKADHQRAVTPYSIKGVGLVIKQDAQGVRTLHCFHRFCDGSNGVACVEVVQRGCRDFGVGFTLKNDTLCSAFGFELHVVFYDAVVHQGYMTAAMRVCVYITRLAVGCPAGVANAAITKGARTGVNFILQALQTSACFHNRNTVFAVNRDSRGIIAAVLQSAKSVQQNVNGVLVSYIANNSTHIQFLSFPYCKKFTETAVLLPRFSTGC